MTTWKSVDKWPYEVSNEGDVRRIGGSQPLRPGLDKKSGYLKVALCNKPITKQKQKTFAVHVLVSRAFLGPLPQGLQVNHKDLNKLNNASANLEYITRLSNVRHAIANGKDQNGEKNGRAKLTEQNVIEARRLRTQGHSVAELARYFLVDRQTMSDAIRGKNWKYLG